MRTAQPWRRELAAGVGEQAAVHVWLAEGKRSQVRASRARGRGAHRARATLSVRSACADEVCPGRPQGGAQPRRAAVDGTRVAHGRARDCRGRGHLRGGVGRSARALAKRRRKGGELSPRTVPPSSAWPGRSGASPPAAALAALCAPPSRSDAAAAAERAVLATYPRPNRSNIPDHTCACDPSRPGDRRDERDR